MSFDGSAVVITGASRGIGRHIALEFSRETRHALFLVARDEEALRSVREECVRSGCRKVETAVCDLTDPRQIDSLDVPETLPQPAVLVNNGGTFLLKPLQQTTIEEFEEQWQVNARGPFQLAGKFLPVMKKQERGLIVNISSVGALKGMAGSGAYSSSKHAMLGFSRSLRLELKESNIAVTAINLGQTMSTSWEGIDVSPDELIDPEDIAKLIVFLTRMTPRTVAEEIVLRPQKGDRSPD